MPDGTLEDLLEEWRGSDVDLAADARVVVDGDGAIVGYAIVRRPGAQRSSTPRTRAGRIGTRLLEWAEGRGGERGRERHRQWVVAANAGARALLTRAGYVVTRTYWRMVCPLEEVAALAGTGAGGLRAARGRRRPRRRLAARGRRRQLRRSPRLRPWVARRVSRGASRGSRLRASFQRRRGGGRGDRRLPACPPLGGGGGRLRRPARGRPPLPGTRSGTALLRRALDGVRGRRVSERDSSASTPTTRRRSRSTSARVCVFDSGPTSTSVR